MNYRLTLLIANYLKFGVLFFLIIKWKQKQKIDFSTSLAYLNKRITIEYCILENIILLLFSPIIHLRMIIIAFSTQKYDDHMIRKKLFKIIFEV